MKRNQKPKRVLPRFPKDWRVPNRPDKWITWSHAERKLRREKIYWITTVGIDGRPHAVPVWGIWTDDAFYFETSLSSVKGRNIMRNPKITFHVQDGGDTVIAQGVARKETREPRLEKLQEAYSAKYDYRPSWTKGGSEVFFRVDPKIVHAWRTPHMHHSMVKFVL